MKQVCKTKKIPKTSVYSLSFCIGRCGIRSCRFSRGFKQISEYEFAISLVVRKQSNVYLYLELKHNKIWEVFLDYAEETQTSDGASQELADIVNQRLASKLDESKLKDKMDKLNMIGLKIVSSLCRGSIPRFAQQRTTRFATI